jgi:hypothetical protein
MLSTHYPQPTTLQHRDLQNLSRLGALAGENLSALLNHPAPRSTPKMAPLLGPE